MVLEKPTSFDSLVHAKMQRCPRCRAPVEKSEGCNQMTCRCGNHFGYVCSAELPRQNPYDHFQGKDAYPLFDGQEEGQEEIDEEEEEEQEENEEEKRKKRVAVRLFAEVYRARACSSSEVSAFESMRLLLRLCGSACHQRTAPMLSSAGELPKLRLRHMGRPLSFCAWSSIHRRLCGFCRRERRGQ